MANPTATLTSLLRGSTIEDHEEVLNAANAVLKSSKNNLDALHTRVVALIKLDRFADALRALDDGGDKLAERCTLEKAYALYKTGQLSEAQKIAHGTKIRGLKHVAAQVAYRAERFEEAAWIYQELSSQSAAIHGEENDLRINMSAADAQLEWQGNGEKIESSRKKPSRGDLEAFETSYNAACGCIARGDLGPGSVLLKRARDLCEALDELSDEEKRAEVLPIMVQQAYVFTKLGKLEEAEALQEMINIADVPELPSRVIAQNNSLVTSTKHGNPFMTQRIFGSVPKLSPTDKLFKYQASILERNRYTIDLQCQKYSGVAYSTATKLVDAPSPTISPHVNSLAVLNAAGHANNEAGKASIKAILPLLEKRPKDVGLILVIIQLYILTNNPGPAINLLQTFFKRLEESTSPVDQDVRFAPGLVALVVSLYRLSGRKGPIKTELGKAAAYWRRKSKPSISLLRAAGAALLESSSPEELSAAGEIFSSLRMQDPKDRTAIAGYIASYATTNLEKVSSDLDKLTPVARLISGIDAAALEEAGVPSLPSPAAATSKKRNAEEKENAAKSKKRKLSKKRMPKNFEEGKLMDPERWLPLRDRSNYRLKGKKGKKKAMDLTQGGVVKEEESLELAGGAGTVKVEKSAGGKPKKKKGKK
ncbi:signal recognition particle protein [Diplocarpon rosae]|nr:signal recognition particle protein [Diplocarpon rosae]